MDRRRFLRDLLTAAVALPLGARLGTAEAGDPARFAEGLRRAPWLGGWKNVDVDSASPVQATINGHWPEGLIGTLYRNGPARFERNGFRYDHWFDGDGMVRAWRFDGKTLQHRARMVETPKFVRERKAGRFVVPATGTTVPDAQSIRNNDDANTANTAVYEIGGRVFALCEAGSAFEIDPDTLETRGAVTWRRDLASLPFSAHPLRDRDGSVWNFGAIGLMGGTGLLVWHLGADGALLRTAVVDAPQQGYLHSFAMTDEHLIFVFAPFTMSGKGAFFEQFRFASAQATRIAVVPKAALDAPRWFETDFAAVYHFADAHRHGDTIRVRAVRHFETDYASSPMQSAMHGETIHRAGRSALSALHLNLRTGKAAWHDSGIDKVEFPIFDARTASSEAAILYAPSIAGDSPYFDSVTRIDLERGKQRTHRYAAGVLAEEHVFVPAPGSARRDRGWLVGTLFDSARQRSGIAVLDAQRVEDGPLAEAWIEDGFPLGFHGCFVAARG